MPRTLLALVLLPLLATAAPVPKPSAKKLADVYGEVDETHKECSFDMARGGALTIGVPAGHSGRTMGNDFPVPLVGKVVEGDFVLTTRIAVSLPKNPSPQREGRAIKVTAGVGLAPADAKIGAVAGGRFTFHKGEWEGDLHAHFEEPDHEHTLGDPNGCQPGAALMARITRRGKEVRVECRSGPDEWKELGVIEGLGSGSLTVGPLVFHSTDAEISVTFEEYEITPLKAEK